MVLSEPYRCAVKGCNKSFKRQEHLSRHGRCHDPSNIFICEVCQKEFNRKDSLNRHLALHSDFLATTVLRKTKRACVSCRKGKNKCNGEVICSTCIRRQVECRYIEDDERYDDFSMGATSDKAIQHSAGPHGVGTSELDSPGSHIDARIDRIPEAPINSQSVALDGFQLRREAPVNSQGVVPEESENASAEAQQTNANMPPNMRPSREIKIIDWMAVEVRRDSVNSTNAGDMDIGEGLKYELYQETFFQSFHHHWPLLHRPTYMEAGQNSPSLLAIRMIGAWLVGTAESREFALVTHERMLEEIIPTLHRITSNDRFQQSLSDGICESALFNIIFGLYQGDGKEISRSLMLLNVLVAALREVGFFQAETAWPDEKPKYFTALRSHHLGKRQRLASYLFKIDNYLSILRNHPPLLRPEELHFTLPSTFALWNANGLHIWEERQLCEPIHRSRTRIYRMMANSLSGPDDPSQPMPIEDIQSCLCATWSSIWKSPKSEEFLNGGSPEIISERAILRRQLDAMRDRLQRISNQLSGVATFGTEEYLSLKYYLGFEDPSLPDSNGAATSRIQSLLVDALMLYHLLSIHLSSNIPHLIRLAKDQYLTSMEEASEVQMQARLERLDLARKWAATPSARRALCHSVDVLVAQAIREPFNAETPSAVHRTAIPDPIAYISLIFAAIIINAYSIYGDCACQLCVPNPSIPRVELTRWSNFGFESYKNERNSWIEHGGNIRPQIHGLPFCQCSANVLIDLYKTYLPTDWELADMVPIVPPG